MYQTVNNVERKILAIYFFILLLTIIYTSTIWGQTAWFHLDLLVVAQNKIFWWIVNAPWIVRN